MSKTASRVARAASRFPPAVKHGRCDGGLSHAVEALTAPRSVARGAGPVTVAAPLAHEKPALEEQGLRNAFEAAFDSDDRAAIARLVRENATEFEPLFEAYTRVWIERTGEAGEGEEHVMARARAIAEAANEMLEASGLLQVIDAIEGWPA